MKTKPKLIFLARTLIVALALPMAGCGKKEDAAPKTPEQAQPAPGAPAPATVQAPTPPPPPGQAAAPTAPAAPVEAVPPEVAPAQSAVEKFLKDHNRMPDNISELLEKGYLKELPKLPSGNFMTIDPATKRVRVNSGA